MTKEEWERLLQHIPWGLMAIALITLLKPFDLEGIGYLFAVGTVVYEAFNDWRKHDKSYKDVVGIVWGWGIGGFGVLIWRLLQ